MQEQDFRTVYKPKEQQNSIQYSSKVLLFGSCFSENIGNKLNYFRFQEYTNSHGILFNPKAIESAVSECCTLKEYKETDLFFENEQWHSFNHHSDFSDTSVATALQKINTNILEAHKFLKTTSHIIITLGTSWIYRNTKSKNIVANCHKIPQKQFNKELLSVEEIANSLKTIETLIKKTNPNVTFIYTVSPIRHLKDGMVENSLSKANLLAAIHQHINSKTSFYFPSYEILFDDLRDYRFYKNDMLHPTQTAIDYIWNLFQKEWINPNTKTLLKEIDTIQKGLQHKAFNPESKAHQKFLQTLASKKEKLKNQYGIVFQ